MKEIYIERREKILRAAVMENKRLLECLIDEDTIEPQPGQIYKGVVKNIVPAIKCAFIDIGYHKNCYMYLDRKFNNTNIKKNDEVMVEVLKGSVGEKGPKVTSAITVPGRYVVLETRSTAINISKKIQDESFKSSVIEKIIKPKEIGLTIRTNAAKISYDTINKEIERLYEIYCQIKRESEYSIKPKLLYSGEGLIDKLIRDSLDESTEKIILDNEEDYNQIKNFINSAEDMKCKAEFYNENKSLFASFAIESEILKLRNREVSLENGAYITIDKTEAMYVIDVNSGSSIKGTSIDKTAFDTNLKAAVEIAAQIRLRNLSGIIVIDFIDMSNEDHKNKVITALKGAFQGDKSKVFIYPFTALNLVQIARERRRKPIEEYLEEQCSCCSGRGKRLSLWYLTGLIRNDVLKVFNDYNCENIYIEIDSIYKEDIEKNINKFINNIEGLNKKIYAKFVEKSSFFKVEPMIFPNDIENVQKYKIYG